MQNTKEVSLKGGRTAQGVVKIGDTIHRSVGKNSHYVQSLLKLLKEKHFKYSPKFLGLDEDGREILSFIDGDVPHGDIKLTKENLVQCAKALREFHDATAGSKLAGSAEVVCHNDFAPWNMVFRRGVLIGIIDTHAPSLPLSDVVLSP